MKHLAFSLPFPLFSFHFFFQWEKRKLKPLEIIYKQEETSVSQLQHKICFASSLFTFLLLKFRRRGKLLEKIQKKSWIPDILVL